MASTPIVSDGHCNAVCNNEITPDSVQLQSLLLPAWRNAESGLLRCCDKVYNRSSLAWESVILFSFEPSCNALDHIDQYQRVTVSKGDGPIRHMWPHNEHMCLCCNHAAPAAPAFRHACSPPGTFLKSIDKFRSGSAGQACS